MYLAIWNPIGGSKRIFGLFSTADKAAEVLIEHYDLIKFKKTNSLVWNKYMYGFEKINGRVFGTAMCSVTEVKLDKKDLILV